MASLNPTSTLLRPATEGAFNPPPAPPSPPAPPAPPTTAPFSDDARDQLWTVQETLHLLHLLTLSRNDDPIIAPEQWSGCLNLLSTQLAQALKEPQDPLAA
ncbi:hypothetical protein [Pseudoxanthomonas indica]|uniref:Uncharacterized protein n=1 Tax=Pseudoxanthomonas indica TaxID=428993 RepID=A0A1T5LH58_9GAMM|nr:hypothetical protein [Pseudoxanthomonas indica]GGD34980.1 hypothetical protein GCM10007235_03650 [Pseudoxanthomonas indica]SKC75174.1 hypothetical protein SAMN06296058_2490 [Pseudoxanthomonas indica]